MSSIVDLSGLDRLIDRVRKLERPNAESLMTSFRLIIAQDNKRGVLAGQDKDGNPMTPVTYRPKGPTVKIGAKSAARFRNNNKARGGGAFAGFGLHAAGLNNNLTRGEYQQLTGPPLAPRGAHSRVITNLVSDDPNQFERSADGTLWTTWCAWFEVVSTKGVPFLPFHFHGGRRLPRRDLAGVRPWGRDRARRAAVAWMSDLIRNQPFDPSSYAA